MENRLLLQRLETSDHGTFGRLILRDKTFYTGELPWRQNRDFQSCIPLGEYRCVWTYSPRFSKHTYELMNVPGREYIRIHSANLVGDRQLGWRSQVDGCITLGLVMGEIRGQKAVLASRDAVTEFENVLNKKPFVLEIIDVTGTIFT